MELFFRSFSHEAAGLNRPIQWASFTTKRRYFIVILNFFLFLQSCAFKSSYLNPLTWCFSVRVVIQACGISYIHTCSWEDILVGGAFLFQNSMDVIFMLSYDWFVLHSTRMLTKLLLKCIISEAMRIIIWLAYTCHQVYAGAEYWKSETIVSS
jgi:membrane-bound acyltransferase YfiQ involved in biofilm formation